jgi:hypothetical protein
MISPKALEEFKALYLKEFGIKLSSEQAYEIGGKLIRLVQVVYGPDLPKKWVSGRHNATMNGDRKNGR